jgi:hypothetical protein
VIRLMQPDLEVGLVCFGKQNMLGTTDVRGRRQLLVLGEPRYSDA